MSKRNPNDTTFRNINALKLKINRMRIAIKDLRRDIATLKRRQK